VTAMVALLARWWARIAEVFAPHAGARCRPARPWPSLTLWPMARDLSLAARPADPLKDAS